MSQGVTEKVIEERGVQLRFKIRGEWYEVTPSPAQVTKLSTRLARIGDKVKKENRDMTEDEQADAGDLLLDYLSGEHKDFFRSLPTEMQQSIVNEMWIWYSQLDMPMMTTDPTSGSFESPKTLEPQSEKSLDGAPTPSLGSNEPVISGELSNV